MAELDLGSRERLVASLPKGGACAEIGVDYGVFSERILDLADPCRLVLVDPWRHLQAEEYGSDPANVSDEAKEAQYQQVAARLGSDPRVRIIRARSEDAALEVEPESLDWIHIDANHLRARQDIDAWWVNVRPGGWITGHDYTMAGDYITVRRDVDAFVAERGLRLFVTTGEAGDIYEKNYPTWAFIRP